ncbi:MAG TPA: LptF/LptG family permease [Candidatus Brocadiia bacterium]|nr:LptF/LptG family permease [Candidatus Brocadiia bacterium]
METEQATADETPQHEIAKPPRLVRRTLSRRFMFLGRLDRYISASFFPAFGVTFFVISGLYMIGGLLNRLDELRDMGVGVALPKVLMLNGLMLAAIAPQLLPAITLVAAGHAVMKLSRSNELLSITAAGMSLRRAFLPLFLIGLFISTISALYFEWPMPSVSELLEMTEIQLGREEIKDVVVEDERHNRVIVVGEFRPREHVCEQIYVLGRDKTGHREYVLIAESAVWIRSDMLRLQRVVEYRYRPDDTATGPGNAVKFMDLPISYPPGQFLTGNEVRPYRLRFKQLKKLADGESYIPVFSVSLHSRLSQPFTGLVLLGMGLPLLAGFPMLAKSHFLGTGMCVIVAGAFYVLTFTCQNLGNTGVLDPIAAAWLPTVTGAAVGLLFMDAMHT